MYNGVGLQTARGSGTSGYVERSLAYAQKKRSEKYDYVEQLKKMRENPLPPPKPANQAILDHEAKRRMANRKFVADNGLRKGKRESRALVEKVDTHLAKVQKQRANERMANAFNINEANFEHGAAFDIELQEMKRLERIAENQEKKRQRKREEKKKRRELEEEEEQLRRLEEGDKESEKSNKSEKSSEKEDKERKRKRKHKKHHRKEKRDKHKKKHKRRKRSRSRSSSRSNNSDRSD